MTLHREADERLKQLRKDLWWGHCRRVEDFHLHGAWQAEVPSALMIRTLLQQHTKYLVVTHMHARLDGDWKET